MFFITTVQIKDRVIKDRRTVGYVSKIEDAKYALENNVFDIYEFFYNYAVIENIKEGIYQYDEKPLWYKWNKEKGGYEPCETPAGFVHKVCIATIG